MEQKNVSQGAWRTALGLAVVPTLLSILAFGDPYGGLGTSDGSSIAGEAGSRSLSEASNAVTADRADRERRRRMDTLMADLEARASVLETGYRTVDDWFETRVGPVEEALRPFHEDEEWVRRIAVALVKEGRQVELDPRVLASVLLVENPWLDPEAESSVGAKGLMQVMPFHAGHWGCGSADLADVETNICHGSRIFAKYLERYGELDRALLAYNGCVRGTNTPDCHMYPRHVYSRAGRFAMERWLRGDD